MKKISKPIVFFGSGPVAAESLRLLAADFSIEAVITKPRPSHHKGSVPVIETAEQLQLPTFTAQNKAELDNLIDSRQLKSEVAILIDFGIIVSQKVINYFELGIINSHFSLLPRWRGADPISFAILSGDTKTGVSLMIIDAGMDTGKLIAQKTLAMPASITTPELTKLLIILSHQLLAEYVPRYIKGEVKPRQQPHPDRATYSRKLTKQDGIIDWHKPAEQIEREIRAYLDWPGSRTTLFGKDVIITKAHTVPNISTDDAPGDVTVTPEAASLSVATSNGSLRIEKLKPAGKKEMTIKAFLSGYYNKKP